MMEGSANKPEMIQEYLAFINENGHKGVLVEILGLFVIVNHSFLAACPDGMVNDPSSNPSEGTLELTYIQMREGETSF